MRSITAARTLYFENMAGRVWEEPEQYLRLEYRSGPREEAQFRALLTHLAQALLRRQWQRILVDQRVMVPFSASEQAWMTTHWLPQAVRECGYRYGAVVLAQNVFARLAMTRLVMATRDLPHTYRNFEHDADALTWLLAQPDA